MADRESVIKGLEPIIGCAKQEKWGAWIDTLEDAHSLLKEQETVDHALDILRANGWKQEEPVCAHCEAVHVVMCKDCKWYDERISMCDNCGLPREQTFFCADGKRK